METWIISIINKFGYFGICFLIAFENIFPPIPSEVILTFGGFMTKTTNMKVHMVTLFSTIGSVIGSIVLYYIGRILNKERLEKIVSGKLGKILRLKPKDIENADKWFDTKGNITVLFCRFIPIVRSLISIPAGMSEMPLLKFLVYTTIGTAIWNTVLVSMGRFMGNNWEVIVLWIKKLSYIILFIIVILLIIGIKHLYKKYNSKS